MAVTQKQAIEAVKGSRGFITAIARRLNISRTQVYNLQAKWPKLAQAITDEREALKDFAESKLFSQIDEGNTTAIIFYLKTQAKDRGYIERQELTGADGNSITIKVKYADLDDNVTEAT